MNTMQNTSCYSENEEKWMKQGQDLREKIFLPLLECMTRWHINANMITILSLVAGLAAALLLVLGMKVPALVLLGAHVILDGFDGPLARHQAKDSPRGSFTDTSVDQAVIAAMAIALVYLEIAAPIVSMIYVASYTVVVGFAMVRNALSAPYSWLFRPRFIVYTWIGIELFLWPGTIDYLLWFFSGLLVFKMMTGMLTIRKCLP